MATVKAPSRKKKYSKKTAGQEPSLNLDLNKVMSFIYPFILLIIFIQVYTYIFDEKISIAGDNAEYYMLGKSIATGEGYKNIQLPNATESSRFPPGYPLIIAGIIKVFGEDFSAVKIFNGLFLFGSVLLLFFLVKRINNNTHLSFVVALFSMLSYQFLESSTIMMSEISFLFFTMLALWFFFKLDFNKSPFKDPSFYFLLASSVFAFHIRSVGLAFFAGVMFYFLWKKNWKYMGSYAGGVVLLSLPWFIRNMIVGGGNGYLKQIVMVNPYRPELGRMGFVEVFERLWTNTERYITREIPSGVLKHDFLTFEYNRINYQDPVSAYEWALGLVILAVLAWGVFKMPKYRVLMLGYGAGVFSIILLWPDIWFGTRLMIGITPLLIYAFFNGIYQLLNLLSQKTINKTAHPLLLLFFLFFFSGGVKQLHASAEGVYHPSFQKYFQVAEWVKFNTPDTAVVACRKPHLFHLFSGRKVVQFKRTPDDKELIQALKDNRVDFVVFDELGYSSTGRYLLPAVQGNRQLFPVAYQIPESQTYLFKFKRFSEYSGDRKDGNRHGTGKMVWDQNYWYEGEWKDDVMHGKGTIHYESGAVYSGEWQDGAKSGYGVYTWKNGTRYEGEWKKDVRNGKGTLYMVNNNRYEGEWKDDKRHGKGTFIWNNGNKYIGEWQNNNREGKGELHSEGYIFRSQWKGDKMTGEVKVYDSTGKYLQTTSPDGINSAIK